MEGEVECLLEKLLNFKQRLESKSIIKETAFEFAAQLQRVACFIYNYYDDHDHGDAVNHEPNQHQNKVGFEVRSLQGIDHDVVSTSPSTPVSLSTPTPSAARPPLTSSPSALSVSLTSPLPPALPLAPLPTSLPSLSACLASSSSSSSPLAVPAHLASSPSVSVLTLTSVSVLPASLTSSAPLSLASNLTLSPSVPRLKKSESAPPASTSLSSSSKLPAREDEKNEVSLVSVSVSVMNKMKKQQQLALEGHDLSKLDDADKNKKKSYTVGVGYSTDKLAEKEASDKVRNMIEKNVPQAKFMRDKFHYMAFTCLDRFFCDCSLNCPNTPAILDTWLKPDFQGSGSSPAALSSGSIRISDSSTSMNLNSERLPADAACVDETDCSEIEAQIGQQCGTNGADDKTLPSDRQTLLDVVKATKNITDWSLLSLELGITQPDLERIERDNHSAIARHKAIILKWLGYGRASWASLVSALRECGVDQGEIIANKIANQHPKVR